MAAKLAVGYTLDELRNEITGGATPASFEPTIDYVVTKIPRFTFEKFPQADDQSDHANEICGRSDGHRPNFQESLQKALRGLETGSDGLNEDSGRMQKGRVIRLQKELQMPGPDRLRM